MHLTATDINNFELVAGFALTLAFMTATAVAAVKDRISTGEMTAGLLLLAVFIPGLWYLLAVPWLNQVLGPLLSPPGFP